MSTATPQRKGLNPMRFAQSLTDMLNRPWACTLHPEFVERCVDCALSRSHRFHAGRMLKNLLDGESARLQCEAQDRIARRVGIKRDTASAREQVVDTLHGAAVVEIDTGFRPFFHVCASGMLGRALRYDEVCEVLEKAERVLRGTREWRTHVHWDADPPVLYVAKIPAQMGMPL